MNPLSLITRVFRFFSVYADPFERQVDHFLRRVRGKSKKDLEALIQRDLVRLTIFFEYKFRGYKKLKKRYRKKLYENASLITKDFSIFFDEHRKDIAKKQKSLDIPVGLRGDEGMTYILGILDYLKLGKRLEYQEAATFEKLLRDPRSEKLVGDCNQITTLYIYLYSLRFPVTDLHVKILPGHICLHYKGVDIETTNGTLANYDDYTFLSNVEEIVASNLLDIPDPSEKQFVVSAANMLKSAELAFHFSGHRVTVEKNLFIAYRNMAVFYSKKKNFSKAIFFANKSGDTKLQKACYQNELADLFDRIKSFKKISDYKSHKATLRRMKELATKVNNRQVIDFVNDILKKI